MSRVPPWVVLALVFADPPAGACQDRPPLAVAAAVPDAASGTITVTGSGFGARPFVTLNLVPLSVRFALDAQISAAAPIDIMPPGTYLLTVSRGPEPADAASIDVTLGGGSEAAVPGGSSTASAAPSSDAQRVRPPAATAPTGPASFGTPDQPAARVGDRVITVADVDREWQRTDPASYTGASRRIHEMRRRIADQLVADELLAREAAARGLSVDALLAEEVPKRRVPMPDSAVLALYQQLGDDARGASLEQMRPALRAWLARFTEPELARLNYVEELMRVSTRADVLLEPPRIAVESRATDAALGPASALVQIVAFGDLRNGRYALFARSFSRVRETFGDRVRIVFKPLPAMEPESLAAGEAAHCAHLQGKFWPFHDAVLEQAGPLGATRIADLARTAGLDGARFETCRSSSETRTALFEALEEAARYDVHSSPSFLVNGRLAPAPPPFLPPFEFFTRLIEEELLAQTRRP